MQEKRKRAHFFLLLAISIVLVSVVNITANFVSAAPDSDQVNLIQANIQWEKTYGGTGDDRAFCATTVGDDYVVAGSSTSLDQGQTLAWVIRLNAEGAIIWNCTYPKGVGSEFRCVIRLTEGFLLVGNAFLSSTDWDGYVVRTDDEGEPQWNITVGGEKLDRLFSALKISDGFILVGLTSSFTNEGSAVWIVKIDENGNIVWNKTYGWQMDDAGRGITLTEDNCFMVAGYTNSTGQGDYDFLTLKIDAAGNMLWNRTYGGAQSDKAYAIAPAQGGYIVSGDTRSKGEGDSDAWIIKLDSNGNLVWDRTVGGNGFDQPTCIISSAHGGFVAGGFTFSFGNGERDFWLFKVDDYGNVLWSSTVGRSAFEEAYAVLETAENEFVMVGWTSSLGAGYYDYYVVQFSVETEGNWLPTPIIVALVLGAGCMLIAALLVLIRWRNKKRLTS